MIANLQNYKAIKVIYDDSSEETLEAGDIF